MADGDNVLEFKLLKGSRAPEKVSDRARMVEYLRAQADEIEQGESDSPVKIINLVYSEGEETYSTNLSFLGFATDFEALGMLELAKMTIMEGND